MINKPDPFQDLNVRIPIRTPIKGRGFINKESTLLRFIKSGAWVPGLGFEVCVGIGIGLGA